MELEAYLRFGLALLFVLGLIGLCAWGAKRLGMTPRVSAGAGRAKRLAIVEVAAVDAKRRLVLVRRDDREHLLLLGAAQDVVVESGIATPAAELAA
jgi:flagellar protein FliO/FliZ